MSLANFFDNFVSHLFVQSSDLKQLEFFSTDRTTDRQTNLLIEAPLRSLKRRNPHTKLIRNERFTFWREIEQWIKSTEHWNRRIDQYSDSIYLLWFTEYRMTNIFEKRNNYSDETK